MTYVAFECKNLTTFLPLIPAGFPLASFLPVLGSQLTPGEGGGGFPAIRYLQMRNSYAATCEQTFCLGLVFYLLTFPNPYLPTP